MEIEPQVKFMIEFRTQVRHDDLAILGDIVKRFGGRIHYVKWLSPSGAVLSEPKWWFSDTIADADVFPESRVLEMLDKLHFSEADLEATQNRYLQVVVSKIGFSGIHFPERLLRKLNQFSASLDVSIDEG